MPATLAAIAGLAGVGGQIFGGLQGSNLGNWLRGGISSANELMQNLGIGAGSGIFGTFGPAVGAPATQNIGNLMQEIWGTQDYPGLLQRTIGNQENFNNLIPGIFNGNSFAGNGTTDAAAQSILGNAGNMSNLGGLAGQVFQGGGWTPQYQQQFDNLSNFLNQTTLGQAGQNALGTANNTALNQGNNQLTAALQGMAGNALGAQGFTPTLNVAGQPIQNLLNSQGNTSGQDALRNSALGALLSGGMTPSGQTAQGAALQSILQSGQNPMTLALQNRGLDLASREALMSPLQVMSMAGNDAMTTAEKQAETNSAKALARGGGPGAVVANGMQNQAFADNADQIEQARSQAMLNALTQQEGLQLQQNQLGSNMALNAGQLAQSNLGTMGNIFGNTASNAANMLGIGSGNMTNAEQLNNQRLLGGLNFIPNLQGAATNNLNVLGNLGLGGGQLALGQLQNANNFIGSMGQLNLGGLNTFNNTMGNQNQYALGSGSLAGQLMGGSNNALNNLFNNQLGAGQLALGQNNGLVNSMLGGLNQSGSLLNTMGGMLNQSYNPLTALAGMGSNIWQTGLSGAAQLFSGGANAATQNPWAQFNPSGGVTGFNGVVGGNGNGGH